MHLSLRRGMVPRRGAARCVVSARRALLGLIVALAAACDASATGDGRPASGSSDAPGSGEVSVRDSAGVTVVENRGGGRAEGRAWSLEPVRIVGAREGEAAFGRVSSVDLGRGGELYVLDRQSGKVTVWDAVGRPVRSLGGLGDGPGEFRTPTFVRALEDGRVVVGEAYPARIHRFAADGSLRESVRVRPGKGGPPILAVMGDWRVTRSGLARVRLSYMSPSHTEGTPVLVGTVGSDGAVADTLLTWTSATTPARLPTIFGAEWSWDLAEDGGLVASPGDRYELRRYDPEGGLRRLVRRRVEAIPTTEAMTDRAVERFFERFADTDVPQATLASLRDRLEVAPTLPPVQGIHLAEPGGELWVEVPTPERTGQVEEAGAYDVFAPSGRFVGRVEAPEGFRLHGVRDDRAYGVWTDELGVEYARVYRVARSAGKGPSDAKDVIIH